MRYEKMLECLKKRLRLLMIVLTTTIALCATSCKTTKTATELKTKATLESSLSEQVDISAEKQITTQEKKNLNVVSNGATDTEIDEAITTIKWSVPDSLGKQYIIEQTQVNRNARTITAVSTISEEESEKTSDELEVLFEQRRALLNKLMIADAELKETTSSKSESPACMNWLIICVIAAALIVVLLVLKRYNIIKW